MIRYASLVKTKTACQINYWILKIDMEISEQVRIDEWTRNKNASFVEKFDETFCKKNKDIIYHIRRCLISSKRPKFPKFVWELDNSDFYFLKFYNFYSFITKRVTGGYLIITSSYLKRKNKKNLVHYKFEGIIFDINLFLKIFKNQDSSKFTERLDNIEYSF